MAIFYIFHGVFDDYNEEMLAILNFYKEVEKQTMILFLSISFFLLRFYKFFFVFFVFSGIKIKKKIEWQ